MTPDSGPAGPPSRVTSVLFAAGDELVARGVPYGAGTLEAQVADPLGLGALLRGDVGAELAAGLFGHFHLLLPSVWFLCKTIVHDSQDNCKTKAEKDWPPGHGRCREIGHCTV